MRLKSFFFHQSVYTPFYKFIVPYFSLLTIETITHSRNLYERVYMQLLNMVVQALSMTLHRIAELSRLDIDLYLSCIFYDTF